MVYSGAQGGIDQAIAQMSSTEKDMYNQNFTRYQGSRVTGSNVRALIGNIISSNNTNQDIDGKIVSIKGDKTIEATSEALNANEMSKYRTEINTGATYTVNVEYNDATGLVEAVEIIKNS